MDRRFRVAMLVVGLLAITLSTPVLAQEATPAGTPDVPAAFECQDEVEPVDLMELLGLISDVGENGGEDGAQLTISRSAVESDLGTTPAISEEDLTGVTETLRLLVACVNAEDPFRLAALLTENYQARLATTLVSEGEGGFDALADHLPFLLDALDSEEGLAVIPIEDSWYNEEVGPMVAEALIAPVVEDAEEQERFVVRFRFSETRWLVDEVMLIEEA